MSAPFVTTIDLSISEKLRQGLLNQGFTLTQPAYTLYQAKKKGVSCTLYISGKLVVQGKESAAFIEFFLEPEILQTFTFRYDEPDAPLSVNDSSGRIGIDESGKGDFFGPLCIAGVYAEGDAVAELKKLGVRDSKELKDDQSLAVAKKIRAKYQHSIIKIGPTRYNELYDKFRNLNSLLAWGHATAIDNLVKETGCTNVIVDKFANERVVQQALERKGVEVDLTQRVRAESDLVVAAASILARAAFLEGLSALSREMEITLPKGGGSRTLSVGRQFIGRHGVEALPKVCKVHFKNYQSIVAR